MRWKATLLVTVGAAGVILSLLALWESLALRYDWGERVEVRVRYWEDRNETELPVRDNLQLRLAQRATRWVPFLAPITFDFMIGTRYHQRERIKAVTVRTSDTGHELDLRWTSRSFSPAGYKTFAELVGRPFRIIFDDTSEPRKLPGVLTSLSGSRWTAEIEPSIDVMPWIDLPKGASTGEVRVAVREVPVAEIDTDRAKGAKDWKWTGDIFKHRTGAYLWDKSTLHQVPGMHKDARGASAFLPLLFRYEFTGLSKGGLELHAIVRAATGRLPQVFPWRTVDSTSWPVTVIDERSWNTLLASRLPQPRAHVELSPGDATGLRISGDLSQAEEIVLLVREPGSHWGSALRVGLAAR